MKRAWFISGILLICLCGLGFGLGSQETQAPAKADTMMKAEDSAATAGSMMKANDSAYNLEGLGPQVAPFTTETAAQSLAKSNTVVYFFAATWCPDCQATYRDLKANSGKLPKNFFLVFVNYDKESALKTKYGISAQHTFVVVDATGAKKKVFNGTDTVADLVKTATSM